jgi:hypothetical protein
MTHIAINSAHPRLLNGLTNKGRVDCFQLARAPAKFTDAPKSNATQT